MQTYDEKYIERKLNEKVRVLGGKSYKFVSPGNSGVPDRLVVLPGGKIGFAEMKRPGGKPSKIQLAQIRFLKNLGCKVSILENIEQIDKFLEEIQR